MTDDELISRGQTAESLLGNAVLLQAFDNIEADCLRNWRNSKVSDVQARENIWALLKYNDTIKAELQRFVDEGRNAKAKADGENNRREQTLRTKQEIAAKLGIPVQMIED